MAWTFNDYSAIYTTSSGDKILIGIPDWAEMTLTGADLTEWQDDLATIQAYEDPLIASGDLTSELRDTTVTIDDVSVAVPNRFGFLTDRIGPCTRLGEGKRTDHFSRRQFSEILFLQEIRAEKVNRPAGH